MYNNSKIAILLSTFNGEKYVEQQVESIITQTYKNIEIFIRDDNSSDKTLKILNDLSGKYQIVHILDSMKNENVGVTKSFFKLLMSIDADYYMFCDQDDVWMNDKVEKTLERMIEVDTKSVPTLVHTNLLLVDSELNVIRKDIWGKNPSTDVKDLMFTNNAAGCTMMINNQMKEVIRNDFDLISSMFMHDWWIVLIAAGFGINEFMSDETMLYRQHNGNVVGGNDGVIARIDRIFKINNEFKRSKKILQQINAFYGRHMSDLNPEDSLYMSKYANVVNNSSSLTNCKVLMKYKPRKSSIGGNLMLTFFMLFFPKKLVQVNNKKSRKIK